jgi:diphthamide synthase (EF-2-diphthine--ammonia ligase)
MKSQGVKHLVFGDLFLEDIRAYREKQLAAAGMTGIFPLWRRDTAALARDMIASGLIAHLVCVDPRRLGREFAGRRFDAGLLAELPAAVDPCGENGEFHTVVSAGPMFAAPIPVAIGAVVERDGFVFADVTTRGDA